MVKVSGNLIIRKFSNKYFLLDPKEEKLHSLNETASFIFSQILSGKKKKEIAKKMSLEYEIDEKTALEDINKFIAVLYEKRII